MRSFLICVRFYLPAILWSYCLLLCGNSSAEIYNSYNLTAIETDTICGNIKPYILKGTKPNGGESGIWTITQGNGTIQDIGKDSTSVTNLSAGELNTFVWTLSIDNVPFKSDTIKVYTGISPNSVTILYPSNPHHICTSADSVMVNETFVGSGLWTTTGGKISDPKENSIKVSDLPLGKTTLTWTVSSKGCPEPSIGKVEIFNDSPSKPFAGNDTSVCSNTVSLTGSKITFESGIWTSPDLSIQFSPEKSSNAVAAPLKDGPNKLIWSVSNLGCSLTDTIVVNNIAPRGANVINKQIPTCADTALILNPVVFQGKGSWFTDAGSPLVLTQTNSNVLVKKLAEKDNILRWRVTNSTCKAFEDFVIITNNLPSRATILTPDTAVCSRSVIIRAKKPTQGEGKWIRLTQGKTMPNDADNPLIINNLTQDVNTFVWQVYGGGCSPINDTINVINQIPDTVYAGADVDICGDEVNLSAAQPKAGYVGTWQLVNNKSTAVLADMYKPNTKVSKLEIGDNYFFWKISKTGSSCPADVAFAYDTVKITNNIPSPINAGKDSSFCFDMVNLTPTQKGNFTNQIVRWKLLTAVKDFKPVFDTTLAVQTVSGLSKSGEYVFKLTVSKNNCGISDTVHFFRNQFTKVDATAPPNTCSTEDTLKGNNPLIEFKTGKCLWRVLGEPQKNGVKIVNPSSYITSIENLTTVETFYVFEYNIWNIGCDTLRDTVTIQRDRYLTGKILVPAEFSVCKDSATLIAVSPKQGIGAWTSVNSGTTLPQYTSTYTFKLNNIYDGVDENTANIFSWKVENGRCEPNGTVVHVKRFLAPPPVILDFDIDSICDNAPLILKGKPPVNAMAGTGKWYFNDQVISDSIDLNIANLPTKEGRNVFTYKITNDPSCTPTLDSVVIYKLRKPDAPVINRSDTLICGNVIPLSIAKVSGQVPGKWKSLNNRQFMDYSNVPSIYYITNLQVGENILKYEVSNGECYNSDTVRIVVGAPPSKARIITPSTILCESGEFTNFIIEAAKPDQGTSGKWISTDNVQLLSRNDSNVVKLSLVLGENKIKWETKGASDFCYSLDSIKIIVQEKPKTDTLGNDRIVHNAEGEIEAPKPLSGIGTWKIIKGFASIESPHSEKTNYTNLSMGKNIFVWMVGNGKCDSISDTLVIDRIVFEVPKAFSPNQDNINDKFEIKGVFEYYPRELVVYNRWGIEVFKNTLYDNNWKGEDLNGQALADDTYYYLLKLENKSIHTGFVLIKR